MKFNELLSVIPRSEVFELNTRDEFLGAFRKVETDKFVDHLDDLVFMISADSSVLQIILI